MPFVVWQEVARQLQKMQDPGVIVPSNSPWSSPVVMVQKRWYSKVLCRLQAT